MTAEFEQWLDAHGCGRCVELFDEHGIDADILPELTDAELADLGVRLGDRKRLSRALAESPLGAGLESATAVAESDVWTRQPGERKPVTMLFADVTGSTSLTQRLDAEDAHALLYGAVERMCHVVEHNRGTVCRFMGDGVMAMFGAPTSYEDHAESACRAALEIVAAVANYGSRMESGAADAMQVRVGVHAGEVVVLRVGSADNATYDASGPTVPLAARMEQSAAPGTVQVTDSTYALVARRFLAEPLDPVQVKGFSRPVATVRLLGERADFEFVSAEPFVGRKAEVEQLRAALDNCAADHTGRLVCLRGEPGIGKTRLLELLSQDALDRGFQVYRTLVFPYGSGKGQDPVRVLARGLLGLARAADENSRSAAVAAAIERGLVEVDAEPFLCDLLDLPAPEAVRAQYQALDAQVRARRRVETLADLVTAKSREGPVLVAIEDLHWASAPILPYVTGLADAAIGSPVIVLVTSRIDGDKLATAWRAEIEHVPLTVLHVTALRPGEARQLARAFGNASDEMIATCVERSGRNPLFLSQLVNSMVIGSDMDLPSTIQTSVAARVDDLEARDKRAIQAAAILGQRFDVDALKAVARDPDYECGQLFERGFVKPEGDGFLFAHALFQEAVTAGLLRDERRALHARAADWYEPRDPLLYAQHLDMSGAPQAAQAYLEAARAEMRSLRYQFARDLVARGLEVAGHEGPAAELHALHGLLLLSTGDMEASAAAYQRAAEVEPRPAKQCEAWIGAAHALRNSGAYERGLGALDQAESVAVRHRLIRELAEVHHHRGNIMFLRVDAERCAEEQHKAMALAREAGEPEVEALAYSGLARVGFLTGAVLSGAANARKCIELARQHGLDALNYGHLHMVGLGLRHELQCEAALEWMIEAAQKAFASGAPRQAVISNYFCAEALFDLRREAECREYAERSRELALQVSELRYLPGAESIVAKLDSAAGSASRAEQFLQGRWDAMDAPNRRFSGPLVLAALCMVASDTAVLEWAIARGRRLCDEPCMRQFLYGFYRDAIHGCIRLGQVSLAAELAVELQTLTAAEPMPLTDFYIRWAKISAAAMRSSSSGGEALVAHHSLAVQSGLRTVESLMREQMATLSSP